MALWSKTTPPKYAPDAVGTPYGWADRATGEILVAGRTFSSTAAAAIEAVLFNAASFAQGSNLAVKVRYNEKVSVTAGATISVANTGTSGAQTLYAAAQNNVQEVLFNKQADSTTNLLVPANVAATQTLTGTGTIVANGETVTIGSKVYTFQTTLTNVDGNVKIAATAALSLTNLFNAINGTGGVSGTDYAALTTAHPTVTATNPTATTVVVTAKTAGTGGNSIATTETSANLAFGAATLAGGVTNSGTLSIAAQTFTGTVKDAAGLVKANGTLTFTGQPLNTETVTVGGKVYTFQTVLTNVDGNVKIGTSASESINNLANAINLTGTGVNYAALTTANANVICKTTTATTLVVEAKVAGVAGNSIGSTETLTNASFGGATLAGGADGVASSKVISAGVATAAGTRVVP